MSLIFNIKNFLLTGVYTNTVVVTIIDSIIGLIKISISRGNNLTAVFAMIIVIIDHYHYIITAVFTVTIIATISIIAVIISYIVIGHD